MPMKPMKNAVGILLSGSLTLALAGTAVCHFGVRYAISQIPGERRPEWEISTALESNGLQSSLALLVAIPLAATVIVLHFI